MNHKNFQKVKMFHLDVLFYELSFEYWQILQIYNLTFLKALAGLAKLAELQEFRKPH